ncbi:hypothetical protein H9P43_006547 [Blastocladiella emersonii ATCC 22665]|nr:hypothetical protein H9P43_006547 [Blastocladiella emersonii ATCC 22665]
MQLTYLLALLATLCTLTAAAPQRGPTDALPHKYVVVLRGDADQRAFTRALKAEVAAENAREATTTGGIVSAVSHEYTLDGFKGYAGTFSPRLAAKLAGHAKVALVEPDVPVRAAGVQESPASWGLRRLSTRALDLTKPFVYPDVAGAGVTIYAIDTGVDGGHADFGGRVEYGPAFCDGCADGRDENGHGTHVAGLAASATWGVAKRARVVSVRVLDKNGAGTMSGILAGITWAANDAKLTGRTKVASLAISAPKTDALNMALSAAYDNRLVAAAAAGNSGTDACLESPASEPRVLTVGASDDKDQWATWSNYGPCVKMVAPGVEVESTRMGGGSEVRSGTSMATGYAAGVLAQYTSEMYASGKMDPTPKLVTAYVKNAGALWLIKGLPKDSKTQNKLLQNFG